MRDTFDMFETPQRGRFGDNELDTRTSRAPRVTGASDLVDIDCTFRMEKPLAIAVSKADSTEWIWLPKSKVEFEKTGATQAKITLPQWLAEQKGLV